MVKIAVCYTKIQYVYTTDIHCGKMWVCKYSLEETVIKKDLDQSERKQYTKMFGQYSPTYDSE